jgi:membrane-bound serine protease (ClpP class)
LAALLLLPIAGSGALPAAAGGGTVLRVRMASIIQPEAAAFLRAALQQADAEGAAAAVVELDTPGGLMTSMHEMSEAILATRTPVVVYVAPSGAQAASAGFFLLMAADLAAMAPGTRTGAAHPVGAGGETIGGTEGAKVEQDAAAAIRSLAARNGRDVALAEQAVVASRSWSAGEALAAHLVDVVAPDLDELLRAADGRHVHKGGGLVVLHTAGATVREVKMTAAQRLLSAVAHPEIAYLLLTLGGIGLFFEITHPGTLLPGVVGVIALMLAFFGLSLLDVNYAGAALILLGMGLFVVELKAGGGGHGAFAAAGAISLLVGSLLLFSGPEPALRLGMEWITAMTLLTLAVMCGLLTVAWRVRRRPVRTGIEGLLHERGVARSELRPSGKVFVHGELWDAAAEQPVAAGEAVEVVAVLGMTLAVRPVRPT